MHFIFSDFHHICRLWKQVIWWKSLFSIDTWLEYLLRKIFYSFCGIKLPDQTKLHIWANKWAYQECWNLPVNWVSKTTTFVVVPKRHIFSKLATISYKCKPTKFMTSLVCKDDPVPLSCSSSFHRLMIFSSHFSPAATAPIYCPLYPEEYH